MAGDVGSPLTVQRGGQGVIRVETWSALAWVHEHRVTIPNLRWLYWIGYWLLQSITTFFAQEPALSCKHQNMTYSIASASESRQCSTATQAILLACGWLYHNREGGNMCLRGRKS